MQVRFSYFKTSKGNYENVQTLTRAKVIAVLLDHENTLSSHTPSLVSASATIPLQNRNLHFEVVNCFDNRPFLIAKSCFHNLGYLIIR